MNPKNPVIAIAILIAFCTGIYFWAEWQKQEFDASLEDILATPEYVERLRVIRSTKGYSPEYRAWAEKEIILRAEGELLDREDPFPHISGEGGIEMINKRVAEEHQRIANMMPEERLAFAEKLKTHMQKQEDWWERSRAHDAKRPPRRPPRVYRGGQQ